MNRKRKCYWRAFYGSDPVSGKVERAKVKQSLHRGIEPQPKYMTGKYWTD